MSTSLLVDALPYLTYRQSFALSLLAHLLMFAGFFGNQEPQLLGVASDTVEVQLIASITRSEEQIVSEATVRPQTVIIENDFVAPKKKEQRKTTQQTVKRKPTRAEPRSISTTSQLPIGGRNSTGILTPAVVSAQPDYLLNPSPMYPKGSREQGEEGIVILYVSLDEQGMVKDLTVSQSSGFERLDQAALKAVQRWKFRPAKRFGIAVPENVKVPVQFKLG